MSAQNDAMFVTFKELEQNLIDAICREAFSANRSTSSSAAQQISEWEDLDSGLDGLQLEDQKASNNGS